MLIYAREKDDGLYNVIHQNKSLSYLTSLCPADESDLHKSKAYLQQVEYAHENDIDLYPVKSVLVTTTWNKNDDVFNKKETWSARHTPTHKPTNIEHDEKQLVGHITNCWAMDVQGNILSDDTIIDKLPDKFHLVTGSVIYKNWESSELEERANNLIGEIEANNKYVSMETLFRDFDYVFWDKNGCHEVKARNEESSWLTKYLRVYGGVGVYEGRKIGRLLKGLTFSGKGYVSKPANPESIIIFDSKNLLNSSSNGVFNNTEVNRTKGDNFMAEKDELLARQNDELKQSLADAQNRLKETEEQLSKADIDKYINEIDKLKQELSDAKQSFTDIQKEKEDSDKELASIRSDLESVQKEKADLDDKISKIEKEKLIANRISTLVDGGIDKEVATKKVEIFGDLNDDQFKVVADELIDVVKAKAETQTDNDDNDNSAANADIDSLDNAQADADPDLNVDNGEGEDKVKQLRSKLSKAMAGMMNRKIEGDN